MMRSLYARVAVAGAVLMMAACERVQLLAPTNSTITVSAPSRVLPFGGSTEVTAFVTEQGGTPVQNGTVVRFSATLGTVNPTEVETRNGLALTTFLAGNTSGVADVRATSGGATGTTTTGTGTTATTTTTNIVQITIGAAAVNTVTLRANPGSVSPGGGTVELIATVVAENARALEGILVTFNTDQGTLSSAVATTNSSGEARTTLTTSQTAKVTATAGTKTSTPVVEVTVRTGPGVLLTCLPATTTSGTSCAAAQASSSGNTVTVQFTISKVSSTSTLRSATIDFGDGTSQSLGSLAAEAKVPHTYTGPSSTAPRSYTATVTATDINGESTTTSTVVSVTPRATPTAMSITLTPTEPSDANKTLTQARWTFSAAVTGGGDGGTGDAVIESYSWDFGDGTTATTNSKSTSHIYQKTDTPTDSAVTVTVTARTADGRTVSTREEIIVTYDTV